MLRNFTYPLYKKKIEGKKKKNSDYRLESVFFILQGWFEQLTF